jgi:hypothetical protein
MRYYRLVRGNSDPIRIPMLSKDDSSPLTLVGEQYMDYGSYINDSFITILENRDTNNKIIGQTVYRHGQLDIYLGNKWGTVGQMAPPKRPTDAIKNADLVNFSDAYLKNTGGTLTGPIYLKDIDDNSPGFSAVNKNYLDKLTDIVPSYLLHLSGLEETRTMIGSLLLPDKPDLSTKDKQQILCKQEVDGYLPHINYIRDKDLNNTVTDGIINIVNIEPSNLTFIFGIVKFKQAELYKDISLDNLDKPLPTNRTGDPFPDSNKGSFKSLGLQVNAIDNIDVDVDCRLIENETSRFIRIIRYGIPTAAIDCSVYFSAIGYLQ